MPDAHSLPTYLRWKFLTLISKTGSMQHFSRKETPVTSMNETSVSIWLAYSLPSLPKPLGNSATSVKWASFGRKSNQSPACARLMTLANHDSNQSNFGFAQLVGTGREKQHQSFRSHLQLDIRISSASRITISMHVPIITIHVWGQSMAKRYACHPWAIKLLFC